MRLTCGRLFWILLIIVAIIAFIFIKYEYNKLVGLPPHKPVDKVIFYDQGWSKQDVAWLYHGTQGSTFPIEYEWFLALEQPIPTFGYPAPPLSEKDYLARLGFLFDDKYDMASLPEESMWKTADIPDQSQFKSALKPPLNPTDLPVGFAIDKNYKDPITGDTYNAIGLTCGACHTGQLNYKGTGIRIEGGQSMADYTKFSKVLGLAMALTACDPFFICDPFRFDRFANNVLGADYTKAEKEKLWKRFKKSLDFVKRQGEDEAKYVKTVEGHGRLDALARIGNYVFGTELYDGNFRDVDAPVSFPYLWGISWYDWVQYNGSVRQPMTRNAGEALGVFATINLVDPAKGFFNSALEVPNLYMFEHILGGKEPFEGLRAPPWPAEHFGKIDQQKAQQGEKLYQAKCQSCHLPPMTSDEICKPQYWTLPNQWDKRFLRSTLVNVNLIGTDDKAATNWAARFVDTKQLGLGNIKGRVGLPLTVEAAVDIKYKELGIGQPANDSEAAKKAAADEKAKYNGYRENLVRAPLCYKARSLDGIWASPPYLHNGSVPNLYQLLSPVKERDKTFYVTRQEYDPKYIGFSTESIKNGFKFDTSKIGNSNVGHEFRDLTKAEKKTWPKKGEHYKYPYNGVLGPKLSKDERWALIEYLKTLKSRNPNQNSTQCPGPMQYNTDFKAVKAKEEALCRD